MTMMTRGCMVADEEFFVDKVLIVTASCRKKNKIYCFKILMINDDGWVSGLESPKNDNDDYRWGGQLKTPNSKIT